MKLTNVLFPAVTLSGAMLAGTALADDAGWFAGIHVGATSLDDTSGAFIDGSNTSTVDISPDSGAVYGLSGGYDFGNGWRSELAWEYRRNDSTATIGDTAFPAGDYASSIVYLNGIYQFGTRGDWTPYVGAGLAWAQEIDVDLERNGVEQSYSASGDTGYQAFAGVRWSPDAAWGVKGELRYGEISGIDFDPESGAPGRVSDLDYAHTSAQIGVEYRF